MKKFILTSSMMFLVTLSFYGQVPTNDLCSSATVVSSIPFNITQDASLATNNNGFITDCGGLNDGVWYTFTPVQNGNIEISLTEVGDSWDPEIAVYSGSCEAFNCEMGVDDTKQGGDERLGVAVTAATQYWVNIGHRSSSTDHPEGIFTLDIKTAPAVPENDTCNSATVVSSFPFNTTQDALLATNNNGHISDCDDGMNDGVWYTFTPVQTGNIEIYLTEVGGSWDPQITVYSGSCGAFNCERTVDVGDEGEDDRLAVAVTAATQYWVNIGHRSSSVDFPEGIFTLAISTAPAVPENDACSSATEVSSIPFNTTQDALSATNNNGFITNCTVKNDGVWYTFTPVQSGNIEISLTEVGVTWDPQIEVYSGSCEAFNCEFSIDNGNHGQDERLVVDVTAATQYWVNIGHRSSSTDNPEGIFTLDMDTTLGVSYNTLGNFSLFPTVINNQLSFNALENVDRIKIYNLMGQQVFSIRPKVKSSFLDLSNLSSGIYFVRVEVEGVTGVIKIIKK